jgi:hypothetical protein
MLRVEFNFWFLSITIRNSREAQVKFRVIHLRQNWHTASDWNTAWIGILNFNVKFMSTWVVFDQKLIIYKCLHWRVILLVVVGF